MRTTTDLPDVQPRPSSASTPSGRTLGRKWWQRPWIAPLALLSIIFVAFSLPPYLSLNPERSRIPPPDDFAAYYPFLVVHVVFGAVALLTTWLQVWPWFRQRHPVAHRRIGRVYVFGGVLPAGLTGLVIGVVTPFGPVARMSTVLLSLLWLGFTVIGYRRARQRQYAEHRRWMIRSFALTASIITNRFWGVIAYLVLSPQLETTFEGSEKMLSWTIAGLSTWLGWVVPLLIAEWWLERGESARQGARLPAPLGRHSMGPA